MPHNYSINNTVLIKGKLVLAKHRNPFTWACAHSALVLFNFAGQNFQKCRLARTVSTDESIAVPGNEFYIYSFKKDPFTVSQLKV